MTEPFTESFAKICRSLVQDSVQIQDEHYWCCWSKGNKVWKDSYCHSPESYILGGLTHLQFIESVRLSHLSLREEELTADWQGAEKWKQRCVYLIRDEAAIKELMNHSPAKTIAAWNQYWKEKEGQTPRSSITATQAINLLVIKLKQSPNPAVLFTRIQRKIKEAYREPKQKQSFEEALGNLLIIIESQRQKMRPNLALEAIEKISKKVRSK